MWGPRYLAVSIFALVVSQIPLHAQECDPSHGRRSFHLAPPYTAEYRERHEYMDYAGHPIPTQEIIQLVVQDSQGRRLFHSTNANGISGSQVFDPVDEKEIVWNTSSAKVKILNGPTPVAGRRSCWRGPDSELHLGPDEPSFGLSEFSCRPADQHQPPYCRDACQTERLAKALPAEKRGFPKCDPAEPGGTAEDLGMDVIQGIPAHGCRTTTPFPKGKRKLREIWSDDYRLTLRRIEEDPTDARYFQELISLSRDEPSPSVFQPPSGYEVVTLEFVEVPCEGRVRIRDKSTHAY